MLNTADKVLTVRVPKSLGEKLQRAADRRGCNKSRIIREALQATLSQKSDLDENSFLAQAQDIVGCVEGPSDLSTHRRHFRGYGS